jgi:hypothetical protein
MTFDVETLPRGQRWSNDTVTTSRRRARDRHDELLRQGRIARVIDRTGRRLRDAELRRP